MAQEEHILLGVDFGSGGCKVTAINASGRLLGEASREYVTKYEHPGWSEQEPADWYRAMCEALAAVRSSGVDFSQISAVAFDGSTHNAVLLDSAMHPIRRTIMWTDQRSTLECAFLKERYGERIFEIAYQMPTPTWTLPQLLWLSRHEPEVAKQTKHILFVKDFVRFLVSGVAATDHIEAQGTLFYDMKKRAWSRELFELTGFDFAALPELVEPTSQLGVVTSSVARDTGIPAGTPVICGTSDSAVEDYGAGAIEPGDCIVKLATAGNVNVMTSEAHPYPSTLTYGHVIPGMWYTVSATNAAALCQRWFRDLFGDVEKSEAQTLGGRVFDLMDRTASTSPIGANGVMFHPYLQGERSPYWDAKLRGSFTGLSIASTRGDFMRALLEGVAFSLLDCYGLIKEMQLPVNRIFLIGGGARSTLWSEILCDVFNLPVKIPSPGDASFGAALLAGTGIGVFSDSREAVNRALHIDRVLKPNAERAGQYAKLFAKYREIHDALAPIYQNL
ncbi:MAG: xylulokinase [Victivallales bacterium]|jgi:xylulokinase|nr:xylulokinase [Victivallales bacterium]